MYNTVEIERDNIPPNSSDTQVLGCNHGKTCCNQLVQSTTQGELVVPLTGTSTMQDQCKILHNTTPCNFYGYTIALTLNLWAGMQQVPFTNTWKLSSFIMAGLVVFPNTYLEDVLFLHINKFKKNQNGKLWKEANVTDSHNGNWKITSEVTESNQ